MKIIHEKSLAKMDSACSNQFRSFVIDQQQFKYEANASAFLEDFKFSIKLSGVKACSTLKCQLKKQTNKKRTKWTSFFYKSTQL